METTMNDEFYVSLASDESAVYFDHANKQSHFTNKLPEPLILREKYVVGLTEIYIPPFFAHKTFMAPEQDTDTNEINIKRATRQIQDDRSELVIHLQGTGWIIHIKNAEAKRLSEKTIAFNGLMALFVKYFEYKELSNLQQDDPRSNEALEKLDAAFQQLDFEQAYTNKKQVRGLFFNVEMPYAVDDETAPYPNFTSEEVTVEMKEYDLIIIDGEKDPTELKSQYMRCLCKINEILLNKNCPPPKTLHELMQKRFQYQSLSNDTKLKSIAESAEESVTETAEESVTETVAKSVAEIVSASVTKSVNETECSD